MPDPSQAGDNIQTITVRPEGSTGGEGKPIPAGAKLTRGQVTDLIGKEMPGLSKAGVEGVVRNVIRESGGNSGDDTGDHGTSGGLFQHHNTRLTGLKDYAKTQGTDWKDPATQVKFAATELKRDYPTLLAQLQHADDPAEAEDSFKRVFERPASIMWENKPKLASDNYRYSDYALGEHKGRKDTDTVYMTPMDFLDLSPDLEGKPFASRSGQSIRDSVGRGEDIESIPSLDMKVNGKTGQVTDQDGRHRALLAQEHGVDAIPVAIHKTGEGDPTEIQGLSGNVIPNDFQKADTAPKSLLSRIGNAITPKAEAAEAPQGLRPVDGNPFEATGGASAKAAEKPQAGLRAVEGDPFAAKKEPDGMIGSAARGFSKAVGDTVYGGQELIGKGLQAVGATGIGTSMVTDARARAKEQEDLAAPDKAAHPYATGAGALVGDIAAGLALPGGIAGKIGGNALRTAALGGAVSGALQPVGNDNAYWLQKAGQTALGAGLGAGVHAVAQKVGDIIAPRMRPLYEFVQRVSGQDISKNPAATAVLKRMEQDQKAGGPTAQDMIDLANATPEKPLTIADVGGTGVQSLTGRVARGGGEGQTKVTNFLNDRDRGAGVRLRDDVDNNLGPGSSYEVAKTLRDARKKAAAPAYEAAYAHPPINPDEMAPTGSVGKLTSRPAFMKGMANARKIAAEEGVDMQTLGVDLTSEGVPFFTKVPTWKTLDYVKRGMDDVVEEFRDSTTGRLKLNDYGHAAQGTRTEFRNTLRQLNEPYAAALDSYSGPSTSLDALHAGEDFLLRKPEEIADRMATYGAGDREFYKLGAADTLRTRLEKKGLSADESKAIINNPYMIRQLRPLFDSAPALERFVASVQTEARMFGTRFNALGGSQTAARRAEDASPDIEAMVHAARGALHLKAGNILGAGKNMLTAWNKLRSMRDPQTNADIAHLLTTPLSDAAVAHRLRDFKQFMASLPNTHAHMNRNALANMARTAGPLAAPGVAGVGAGVIPQMIIRPQQNQGQNQGQNPGQPQ